jgi:flagellar FliL protein
MADNEEQDVEAAPPPRRKKKGGAMKWLFIAALVVVLGGAGAAWWLMGAAPTEAAEPETTDLALRGGFAFEPFLVNLADEGGQRFLKATVQIALETQEQATHLEETPVIVMHLRSAILEVLTMQKAAPLVTPEGKSALKQAIKDRIAPLLPDAKVVDVLFSEFVVQF